MDLLNWKDIKLDESIEETNRKRLDESATLPTISTWRLGEGYKRPYKGLQNEPVYSNTDDTETFIEMMDFSDTPSERLDEKSQRLQEGPGAGYSIYFYDIKLQNVKITKIWEDKYGVQQADFTAEIMPGKYDWSADGYDWAVGNRNEEFDGDMTFYQKVEIKEGSTVEGSCENGYQAWGDPNSIWEEEDFIKEIQGEEYILGELFGGGYIHSDIPDDFHMEDDIDCSDERSGYKNSYVSSADLKLDAWIINQAIEDTRDYDPEEDDDRYEDYDLNDAAEDYAKDFDAHLTTDDRQAGQWHESKESKIKENWEKDCSDYYDAHHDDKWYNLSDDEKAEYYNNWLDGTLNESKKSDKSRFREGTWSIPNTKEKAQAILDLMQNPVSSDDAPNLMYGLYGDDKLFDAFYGYSSDVRPIIKHFIKNLVWEVEEYPNSWKRGNTPIVWEPEAIEILKKVASFDDNKVKDHHWIESKSKNNSLKIGNIVKYDGKSYIVKKFIDGNVTIQAHGKSITLSPDKVEKIFDEASVSQRLDQPICYVLKNKESGEYASLDLNNDIEWTKNLGEAESFDNKDSAWDFLEDEVLPTMNLYRGEEEEDWEYEERNLDYRDSLRDDTFTIEPVYRDSLNESTLREGKVRSERKDYPYGISKYTDYEDDQVKRSYYSLPYGFRSDRDGQEDWERDLRYKAYLDYEKDASDWMDKNGDAWNTAKEDFDNSVSRYEKEIRALDSEARKTDEYQAIEKDLEKARHYRDYAREHQWQSTYDRQNKLVKKLQKTQDELVKDYIANHSKSVDPREGAVDTYQKDFDSIYDTHYSKLNSDIEARKAQFATAAEGKELFSGRDNDNTHHFYYKNGDKYRQIGSRYSIRYPFGSNRGIRDYYESPDATQEFEDYDAKDIRFLKPVSGWDSRIQTKEEDSTD